MTLTMDSPLWRILLAGARRQQAAGRDGWCGGAYVMHDRRCSFGHCGAVAAGHVSQHESVLSWSIAASDHAEKIHKDTVLHYGGVRVATYSDHKGFRAGAAELRRCVRRHLPDDARARLSARAATRAQYESLQQRIYAELRRSGLCRALARVDAHREAREVVRA